MTQTLAAVTIFVDDYQTAIAYYTTVLGFDLLEHFTFEDGTRLVLVAPAGGCALRVQRPDDPAQMAGIRRFMSGRPSLFLRTDDFDRDHALYVSRGIVFTAEPSEEDFSRSAPFKDTFGYVWELRQPRAPSPPDLIPNETTAIAVIEAVLAGTHSERLVESFKPYRAYLQDGEWHVVGTSQAQKEAALEQQRLGPGYFISIRGGGQPHCILSARDGRVTRLEFER